MIKKQSCNACLYSFPISLWSTRVIVRPTADASRTARLRSARNRGSNGQIPKGYHTDPNLVADDNILKENAQKN